MNYRVLSVLVIAQSCFAIVVLVSTKGICLQVAIALSLLVSEVTAPPFNNTVCTFSSTPELHEIAGSSLVEKVCAGLLCYGMLSGLYAACVARLLYCLQHKLL